MLRILLNIAVGLGILISARLTASTMIRSGDAPLHFQEQARQLQSSQVAVQTQQRIQMQTVARSDGGSLSQSQDRTRVRQRDQLHAATQVQLQQRDQLRFGGRAQSRSQINSRMRTQPGQTRNQQ